VAAVAARPAAAAVQQPAQSMIWPGVAPASAAASAAPAVLSAPSKSTINTAACAPAAAAAAAAVPPPHVGGVVVDMTPEVAVSEPELVEAAAAGDTDMSDVEVTAVQSVMPIGATVLYLAVHLQFINQ
jgi:hypothetical protein